QLAVDKLKELSNFCAIPYIGNFCRHFTFRPLGQVSYGVFNTLLVAPADCNASAGNSKRLGDRQADPTRPTRNHRVFAFEKCVHGSMLTVVHTAHRREWLCRTRYHGSSGGSFFDAEFRAGADGGRTDIARRTRV